MTRGQKKMTAEKWLESLNFEHKAYYVNLLSAVVDNGGDLIESAYQCMLTHKQAMFNIAISKLDPSRIIRSMFPKGFKGWFSWVLARNSAMSKIRRTSSRSSDRQFFRNYEKATMSAMEKTVNNVRFWDQRPNITAGQVTGDYIRQ